MYLAVPPGQKTIAWSEMTLDREVRRLINVANTVSATHLKDGLTRIKFVEEIRDLILQQLASVRRKKTVDAYTQATQILQAETANLLEQDRLIRTKAAQLYAKVEFVKENNEIVGYVISAVSVVLAGVSLAVGATMIATMTPLGVVAGAILVTDGFNSLSKEFSHRVLNDTSSEGFAADAAISVAEFMGFSRNKGLAAYEAVSLTASVYSIFGLMRKPGTWRLFHYLPEDYYRKVSTISRPKLTMKIMGYGLKAKVVFDLLSADHSTS